MMKKLLAIVVLGLLFSGNAYANERVFGDNISPDIIYDCKVINSKKPFAMKFAFSQVKISKKLQNFLDSDEKIWVYHISQPNTSLVYGREWFPAHSIVVPKSDIFKNAPSNDLLLNFFEMFYSGKYEKHQGKYLAHIIYYDLKLKDKDLRSSSNKQITLYSTVYGLEMNEIWEKWLLKRNKFYKPLKNSKEWENLLASLRTPHFAAKTWIDQGKWIPLETNPLGKENYTCKKLRSIKKN